VTGLRLLAAAVAVAALGALGARLAPAPRREAPPRPAAAASPRPAEAAAVHVTGGPDLRDVPAGILARAADARALERGPVCRPSAPRGEAACAPQRDTVEIQWDVVRDP
jgi:hypothetical protein